MKFNITYQRALAGNDIDVQIDAEDKETIGSVRCSLDGFEIGCDDLSDTPVVSFHRSFPQAGDARSGQTHKFVVEVGGGNGEPTRLPRVSGRTQHSGNRLPVL